MYYRENFVQQMGRFNRQIPEFCHLSGISVVRIYPKQKFLGVLVAQTKTCHHSRGECVWISLAPCYLSQAYSGTGSGMPLRQTQILHPLNLWHTSFFVILYKLKILPSGIMMHQYLSWITTAPGHITSDIRGLAVHRLLLCIFIYVLKDCDIFWLETIIKLSGSVLQSYINIYK